jgi:nitroimidazol reductase NimA-like FMN-containing flavoprotein (pyridoxamine 5'-phosphate oxidase superfamily)
MYDSPGLEVLEREECLKLLASVSLGRIIYTERAMPAVQPVNFAVHGGVIVLRTPGVGKLSAATRNAVVAFEADSIAEDLSAGWSVSVLGHAAEVTDHDELRELALLPLRVWNSADSDHYIRITVEMISGRRVRSAH